MNPAFSKKLLARNPFQKNCLPATLFKKRLDRKPRHSSNKVVGMINRRND
ncbi:hypothetical protein [Methanosarcina barkeri]|nr:hypothetical protein [Methanosarcina barkeri]